jgi:hypothetical protein
MCYDYYIPSLFLFTNPEEEKMNAVMDVLFGFAGIYIGFAGIQAIAVALALAIGVFVGAAWLSRKKSYMLGRYLYLRKLPREAHLKKEVHLKKICLWLYIFVGSAVMIAVFLDTPNGDLVTKGFTGLGAGLAAAALLELFFGNGVRSGYDDIKRAIAKVASHRAFLLKFPITK